jgi:hypothetical protein
MCTNVAEKRLQIGSTKSVATVVVRSRYCLAGGAGLAKLHTISIWMPRLADLTKLNAPVSLAKVNSVVVKP